MSSAGLDIGRAAILLSAEHLADVVQDYNRRAERRSPAMGAHISLCFTRIVFRAWAEPDETVDHHERFWVSWRFYESPFWRSRTASALDDFPTAADWGKLLGDVAAVSSHAGSSVPPRPHT